MVLLNSASGESLSRGNLHVTVLLAGFDEPHNNAQFHKNSYRYLLGVTLLRYIWLASTIYT